MSGNVIERRWASESCEQIVRSALGFSPNRAYTKIAEHNTADPAIGQPALAVMQYPVITQ